MRILEPSPIIQQIDCFLVEDARTARKFIKEVGHPKSLAEIQIVEFNKHQPVQDMEAYIQPLRVGKDMGILSESGCPGVADPSSELVQYAHKNSIPVIPLIGPCSLLLAFMASGFNGQNFAFHGYLPIDQQERKQAIRQLEATAWQSRQTQIFIEIPYRNEVMLEALLATCKPTTWPLYRKGYHCSTRVDTFTHHPTMGKQQASPVPNTCCIFAC